MTNRQPKGTPVGGQFAEGRKPDGSDLKETRWNYIEADLSGRDLSMRTFNDGHFLSANCAKTKFNDCNMVNADFLNAHLEDADFNAADLTNAIFIGANAHHTSFIEASLEDAHCFQADFSGSDFTGANVEGADFREATGFTTVMGLATVKGKPKELPEGWSHAEGRGIFKDEPSTERKTFRVTNSAGVPFEVRIIRKGERYGLNNMLANDEGSKFFNPKDPILVEFWDAGQDPAHFPGGCQFTGGRYSLTTLVSREGARLDAGLDLYGGEPRWSIDAKSMQSVCEWLTPIVGEIEEAS